MSDQSTDDARAVGAGGLPADRTAAADLPPSDRAEAERSSEQPSSEQRSPEQRSPEQRSSEQRSSEQRSSEQPSPEQRSSEQPSSEQPSPEQRSHGDVEKLQRRVDELEDSWRRALADLDNMRKRTARDASAQQAAERARAAMEWLPVLDNLDLALEHSRADPEAIIAGVRAVRDQALAILASLGYPRRDDLGERFDPAKHEAVAAVPAAEPPEGTILQVVRPGYGEGERQLRPAAVVVATRPEGSA